MPACGAEPTVVRVAGDFVRRVQLCRQRRSNRGDDGRVSLARFLGYASAWESPPPSLPCLTLPCLFSRLTLPHLALCHMNVSGISMADEISHKSYRPLTALTFRLNVILAGGLHPFGFHVVVSPSNAPIDAAQHGLPPSRLCWQNIALHTVCSVCFWLLCSRHAFPTAPRTALLAGALSRLLPHTCHAELSPGISKQLADMHPPI